MLIGVLISGVNEIPFLSSFTNTADLSVSAISSQTGEGGGSAGNVSVKVSSLELLDGGTITTETFGPGNAGIIEVVADSVRIAGVNEALKDFLLDFGDKVCRLIYSYWFINLSSGECRNGKWWAYSS